MAEWSVKGAGGAAKLTRYTEADCTTEYMGSAITKLYLPEGIVFKDIKMAAIYAKLDSNLSLWIPMTGDKLYGYIVNASGQYIDTNSYNAHASSFDSNYVEVSGYGTYAQVIKVIIYV